MTLLFSLIAFVYAQVGYGGGSSYIALMALLNFPYQEIPSIALICNIIVVSGAAIHYFRSGYFDWSFAYPFFISSVPMAFIGGCIPISKTVFLTLLGSVLTLAGLTLLITGGWKNEELKKRKLTWKWRLAIGGFLGLLSGLSGIGGGVFLSPILLFLGCGTPKQIASTASVFILANSISGLIGHLLRDFEHLSLGTHLPILLAVFCGGQIGGLFGAKFTSQFWVKKCTAIIVVFVGSRLLFEVFS